MLDRRVRKPENESSDASSVSEAQNKVDRLQSSAVPPCACLVLVVVLLGAALYFAGSKAGSMDIDAAGTIRGSTPTMSAAPLASSSFSSSCPDTKWRNDELVGKCFGLQCGKDPETAKVTTAEECEAICCYRGVLANLPSDERCVTWQFRQNSGCCVGPAVRLGLEQAPTAHWCEPQPPARWAGRRLVPRGRTVGDGATCTWEEADLAGQCFGLGPVKPPTTPEACERACCDDPGCTVWQFEQSKGCFYGRTNQCTGFSELDLEPYAGRRKHVPVSLLVRSGKDMGFVAYEPMPHEMVR